KQGILADKAVANVDIDVGASTEGRKGLAVYASQLQADYLLGFLHLIDNFYGELTHLNILSLQFYPHCCGPDYWSRNMTILKIRRVRRWLAVAQPAPYGPGCDVIERPRYRC